MATVRIGQIFSTSNNQQASCFIQESTISSSRCMFCLKTCSQTQEDELIPIFFKLVCRYFREKMCQLGSRSDFQKLARNENLGCCSECLKSVELFYETYYVIKCLELELNGVLDRIKTTMKSANDNAGRLSNFRDWCLQERQDMEASMQFRATFQRLSELTLAKSFPRVSLRRLSTEKRTEQPQDNNLAQSTGSTVSNEVQSFNLLPMNTTGNNSPEVLELDPNVQIKVEANLEHTYITPPNDVVGSTPTPPDSVTETPDFSPGPPDSPPASPTSAEPPTKKLKMSPSVALSEGLYRSPTVKYEQTSLGVSTLPTAKKRDCNRVKRKRYRTNSDDGDDDDGNSPESDTEWVPDHQNSSDDEDVDESVDEGDAVQLKCTTCPEPYPKFKSARKLQCHRKYAHTNAQIHITKKRELFNLARITEYNIKLRDICLTSHTCPEENCQETYALQEELENHTKFHGQFNCEFCNKVQTTVQSLVQHETKPCKMKSKTTISPSGFILCARCEFSTKVNASMVTHYLEHHLSLDHTLQAVCPVCKQVFKETDKVPIYHYVNYHDLSRLTDPSNAANCRDLNCSAYFLREDQQQHHWKEKHSVGESDKNSKKSSKVETAHKCQLCQKSFKWPLDLKQHNWIFHADKNWSYTRLTPGGLSIAEFVDAKYFKFVCGVKNCEKKFLKKIELTRHSKLHGKFQCKFCEVVETQAPDLALHELSHGKFIGNINSVVPNEGGTTSGFAKFSCPRCPFNARFERDYIQHHVEVHLQLKPDKKLCPICKKQVSSKAKSLAELKQWVYFHYMEHHDMTDLDETSVRKCDQKDCKAYFRNLIQLHRHMVEIHWGGQEMCWDCEKTYKTIDKLNKHRVQSHKVCTEDFQFVCPQCEKRYEREFELELHLQNHERVKGQGDQGKEVCNICGKTFLGTGPLIGHKKTHEPRSEGSRQRGSPFFCDQCGKSFTDKHYMEVHIKIYHNDSEDWKFSCEVCGKKCANKMKLEEHLRTHSKEKPFVCSVCGEGYAHRHNLRNHVNSKHSDIMVDLPRKKRKHRKPGNDGVETKSEETTT